MTRRNAFAIALVTGLLVATGAQAAPTRDETQAPRGQDVQAPRDRNEDVQAPRG